MRYSSSLVLGTLAIGQAAAANAHNRHVSFHERRHAEAKRDLSQVDWKNVAYDLSHVDWSKVFPAAGTPSQAPSQPQQQPQQPQQPQQQQASAAPANSPAAAPAPAKPQNANVDANKPIGDAMHIVQSVVSRLGVKTGKNEKSNNGGAWIGSDSPWQVQFTNSAKDDAVIYCWRSAGYGGMFIAVSQADVSAGIPSGGTVTLSFAPNVGMACSPVYPDTALTQYGHIGNTWFEVTFAQNYGTFDISRQVKANGRPISAQGSKCRSDMDTCVFKCKGAVDSCETGYDLFNCGASSGGGGGYDPNMKGTGGGCAMAASSETVKVTLS